MPTPAYRITVNGKAKDWGARLISLTLRDCRGFEADQLTVVIDDHDGAVNLPATGAVIGVWLGWEGAALVDKGTFTVDQVGHDGPPDKITVSARSADFREGFKEKRTKSWHQAKIGAIVQTIAARYKLTAAVGEELAGITVAHVDQTDESDAHFLTRLAFDHDAIATVKAGRLLFVRAGESRTAGGKELTPITIERSEGDSHTYDEADRESRYSGVKARYLDHATAQAREVLVGEEGKVKTLRRTFPNHDTAAQAADAEWRRVRRGGKSLALTLAKGNPALLPETPITARGWKKPIDGQAWVATEVTHTIDGALTTAITLEPAGELDDDGQ